MSVEVLRECGSVASQNKSRQLKGMDCSQAKQKGLLNDQRPACSSENVAAERRKDPHEGLLEGFILLLGGEALHLPTRASWDIQEQAVPSQWWHRRAMIDPPD
jgi:hypothetical protein